MIQNTIATKKINECAAIIDRSVTDAMFAQRDILFSEFVQRSMIFWNHAVECNDLLEWNTQAHKQTTLNRAMRGRFWPLYICRHPHHPG